MYSQKVFVLQQTFSRHNIKQAFCLWLIENVRISTDVSSPQYKNKFFYIRLNENVHIPFLRKVYVLEKREKRGYIHQCDR